jgi:hypothetical protein
MIRPKDRFGVSRKRDTLLVTVEKDGFADALVANLERSLERNLARRVCVRAKRLTFQLREVSIFFDMRKA